jgi:hypothetical protein
MDDLDDWLLERYPDVGSRRARLEAAAGDLRQLEQNDAVALIGRR